MFDTISQARSAYGQSASAVRCPRNVEYDAFANITARLTRAMEQGATGFSALAEALHLNRQLWWILASDVADKENGLPQNLRAQIFYLAEFTDQHTSKVLRHKAEAQPLVEINTMIMRGLKGVKEGTT